MKSFLFGLLKSWLQAQVVYAFKARSLVIYLKAVQSARLGLLLLVVLVAAMQFVVLCFFGALVSGVWLLPLDNEQKLWTLFGSFSFIAVSFLVILKIVFSEKLWYEKSGARAQFEDLQKSA